MQNTSTAALGISGNMRMLISMPTTQPHHMSCKVYVTTMNFHASARLLIRTEKTVVVCPMIRVAIL